MAVPDMTPEPFFPIPTPLHHLNTDYLSISPSFFNCRSVLLDPAAPWPTDGILCWLALVIADHLPVRPDVLLPLFLGSLFALVVLALISSLLCQLCFRAMDSNEPPTQMDVDEEVGKNQDLMESSEEQAIGLPFPGALLADGTFAVEYHIM